MPLYSSLNNPLSDGDTTFSNEASNEDGVAEAQESFRWALQLSPSHLGKTLHACNEKYCPNGHKMRN